MKKISIVYLLFCSSLVIPNAGAQVLKPKIDAIKFLVSGQSVVKTGKGSVIVELTFNRFMNRTVDPVVKFGFQEPFKLSVPPNGMGWKSGVRWQGIFEITEMLPSPDDGAYVFQIYGAQDTTGVLMDATLSTDPPLNTSLFICRTGELNLSTDTLDFDTLKVNASKTLAVTFTNPDTEDVKIQSISVPTPFHLVNSFSNFIVPANSRTIINIRFTPQERREFNDVLTIETDDCVQKTHTIQLKGWGRGPKIALFPGSSLDFGHIDVGRDTSKTIKVTNVPAENAGLSDRLVVNNISTSNPVYTVFPTSLDIAAGVTKTVTVTFTPDNPQSYNGFLLTFTNDDLSQAARTVVLNGDATDQVPPPAITNLSVTWPGISGITNGKNLDICWDNPNDLSGISEIWWKFTTSPVPPVDASDTTAAGGRTILTNGDSCASLNLHDRLTSGVWYCYLWVVDGAGNSGWQNTVQTSFRYDVVAPGVASIVSRSIPESQWFGANDIFQLTINIPAESGSDRKDASEVRWKYKQSPENTDDYDGRYFIQASDPDPLTFTVPFADSSLCGDNTLYFWLADLAGNSSLENVNSTGYRFDICSVPFSDIQVTWTGFNGYTNADSLPVCWQTLGGSTKITELWWKFTREPIPPTSPADTTVFGGRIVADSGVACANLRMDGRLVTGYWYCYAWPVFANGNNTAYLTPVVTAFTYDVNAPGRAQISARSIPESDWFSTEEFQLAIKLPADAGKGFEDASEVRWKYRSKPVTVSDFDAKYKIQASDSDPLTITIPFADAALCGDDSVFFWLADSAGNVSLDGLNSARYRFDICAPVIKKPGPEKVATLGVAFKDTVVVTDDAGIDSVWIRYRFGGAESEQFLKLLTRIDDGDSFVLEIPKAGVTRRGIEYNVTAVDLLGNEALGPVEAKLCAGDDNAVFWIPVKTRVGEEGDSPIDSDGNPVPLLSGENAGNYQLISVPYHLDFSGVMSVLQDDLGSYDKTLWRLFDYKTDNADSARWLEGRDARPFIPGRSFFIITKQKNIVIDGGPGVTQRTVCPDSVRVYDGWNLIATPFNFPIAKSSLKLINADTSLNKLSLRAYENGWVLTDVMQPWKGYALFVTKPKAQADETAMYLQVQPKASAGRLSKTVAQKNSDGWRIRISASAGTLSDEENWAGVSKNARSGFDQFELVEPPVIGNYLQVLFPRRDWIPEAEAFSTDIQPANETNHAWTFEVNTNLVKTAVSLSFDFQGDLPGNVEIYLIDASLKTAQNLREKSSYSFISGKLGSQKTLKLIVGSLEFASVEAGANGLIPQEFALLQNYPNPFNPETTIRYNLVETATVKLEIFDLLGRKVATLVDNEVQNAGFYTARWNGRNQIGTKVASGVYVYRIKAGKKTVSRKMLLLK